MMPIQPLESTRVESKSLEVTNDQPEGIGHNSIPQKSCTPLTNNPCKNTYHPSNNELERMSSDYFPSNDLRYLA